MDKKEVERGNKKERGKERRKICPRGRQGRRSEENWGHRWWELCTGKAVVRCMT